DREQLKDGDVITFGMTRASFVGDAPQPRVNPARQQRAAPQARNAMHPGADAAPEGIVADEARRGASPFRPEVKTADELETATLQRQIKELEHRVAIRGAESDAVARQLKEKDDLIAMLSDREDELQKEIKVREEKAARAHDEVNAAREQLNAAAGKEKELNDKLKQKNVQ